MPRRVLAKDLSFVSKGRVEKIASLRSGVSLEARTGYTIDELLVVACRDRIILARDTLASANKIISSATPSHRAAVARAYYAMYHTARAVVFYVEQGDDYQDHSELPKHIPNDFPDRAVWENELKNARFERNRADYEPYPRNDVSFAEPARRIIGKAKELLKVSRSYLRTKGCPL
jgi:uncharacterized protein (UPF0332 family)